MNSKEDFIYGVNRSSHLPTADEVWVWLCIFMCGAVTGIMLF